MDSPIEIFLEVIGFFFRVLIPAMLAIIFCIGVTIFVVALILTLLGVPVPQ